MTCEPMQTEHLNDIAQLQQEWAAEHITYGFVAGTPEQIAVDLSPYCYVLKDAQRVIGYLMAEVRHDNEFCVFPQGVDFVEVLDLFISKDYRSRGLGKVLLGQCEADARQNGLQHMLLSSATKDAEAVRHFYTSNDYTIWTTQFFKRL
ncbi:MAG: GNAT family N-acetyltransferase [Oscillospiraceae bacterium]|nr:GNAT family N-acetyltransferase [Oscillospiraceae bacterium]